MALNHARRTPRSSAGRSAMIHPATRAGSRRSPLVPTCWQPRAHVRPRGSGTSASLPRMAGPLKSRTMAAVACHVAGHARPTVSRAATNRRRRVRVQGPATHHRAVHEAGGAIDSCLVPVPQGYAARGDRPGTALHRAHQHAVPAHSTVRPVHESRRRRCHPAARQVQQLAATRVGAPVSSPCALRP